MWNTERADSSEKLTRIPERYAWSEGEHIHEQQEDGGRPARRGKSSYLERPGNEKLNKNTSAASELPKPVTELFAPKCARPCRARRLYVRHQPCIYCARAEEEISARRSVASAHFGSGSRAVVDCVYLPEHRAFPCRRRQDTSRFSSLLPLGVHRRAARDTRVGNG